MAEQRNKRKINGACKKAQDNGYHGECFDCPFPQRFRDTDGAESMAERKERLIKRNKRIRKLAATLNMAGLRKISGLKSDAIRDIINRKGSYVNG